MTNDLKELNVEQMQIISGGRHDKGDRGGSGKDHFPSININVPITLNFNIITVNIINSTIGGSLLMNFNQGTMGQHW